jgi:hypothetical protein
MMMMAVLTSETSAYFNQTIWHYVPEGCALHARKPLKPETLTVVIKIKTRRVEICVSYTSF